MATHLRRKARGRGRSQRPGQLMFNKDKGEEKQLEKRKVEETSNLSVHWETNAAVQYGLVSRERQILVMVKRFTQGVRTPPWRQWWAVEGSDNTNCSCTLGRPGTAAQHGKEWRHWGGRLWVGKLVRRSLKLADDIISQNGKEDVVRKTSWRWRWQNLVMDALWIGDHTPWDTCSPGVITNNILSLQLCPSLDNKVHDHTI